MIFLFLEIFSLSAICFLKAHEKHFMEILLLKERIAENSKIDFPRSLTQIPSFPMLQLNFLMMVHVC